MEVGTDALLPAAYKRETWDRFAGNYAGVIRKDLWPNVGKARPCRCRQDCATSHRNPLQRWLRIALEPSNWDCPNNLARPVQVPNVAGRQASGASAWPVDCCVGLRLRRQ